MLKIKFSEIHAEGRWILHGRLTNPWVQELRGYWKKNHRADAGPASIVDVEEVTFIDKSGKQLLRMLARGGAQFTASFDTFDRFNFLNVDIFNFSRSSPENPVSYGPASLAWGLRYRECGQNRFSQGNREGPEVPVVTRVESWVSSPNEKEIRNENQQIRSSNGFRPYRHSAW